MKPVMTPMAKLVAAVPSFITGLASTLSGRNGSGARLSHQPTATVSRIDAPISAKIVGESHGTRVPPVVSARRNSVAAAITSATPRKSSECLRPAAGSRFIDWLSSAAVSRPSGTLSQKISDQCQFCAMMPPSAGPTTPALIQAVPI
jgi:hypothetical protein